MSNPLKVACIQTNAGPEILPNLERIEPMIREAAGSGAKLIALPEMADAILKKRVIADTPTEENHPALSFFKKLARATGAWIVGGSFAIHTGGDRLANRSYVFSPDGEIAATYDKIHMFDVDLGATEAYRESNTFRPGDSAKTVATPWGLLGLTICYDMRFPQLYRVLAKAGVSIITVPSAFTVPTGQAHWHTLLRARAIETGAFILAPAQCGEHDGGRKTYGHSLVIGPWGEILAEAGETPGVITATLDLDHVAEARRKVPSLHHDRAFKEPRPASPNLP